MENDEFELFCEVQKKVAQEETRVRSELRTNLPDNVPLMSTILSGAISALKIGGKKDEDGDEFFDVDCDEEQEQKRNQEKIEREAKKLQRFQNMMVVFRVFDARSSTTPGKKNYVDEFCPSSRKCFHERSQRFFWNSHQLMLNAMKEKNFELAKKGMNQVQVKASETLVQKQHKLDVISHQIEQLCARNCLARIMQFSSKTTTIPYVNCVNANRNGDPKWFHNALNSSFSTMMEELVISGRDRVLVDDLSENVAVVKQETIDRSLLYSLLSRLKAMHLTANDLKSKEDVQAFLAFSSNDDDDEDSEENYEDVIDNGEQCELCCGVDAAKPKTRQLQQKENEKFLVGYTVQKFDVDPFRIPRAHEMCPCCIHSTNVYANNDPELKNGPSSLCVTMDNKTYHLAFDGAQMSVSCPHVNVGAKHDDVSSLLTNELRHELQLIEEISCIHRAIVKIDEIDERSLAHFRSLLLCMKCSTSTQRT